MRLYLHIGTHKTGSTAVQRFFAANDERLRSQGLLYPRQGRPLRKAMSYGHHLLARELRYPTGRTLAWSAVVSELQEAEQSVALVSSENFDLLIDDAQLATIRSQLRSFDVKVVVYLRRQDEFLHAYYCTDVLFHGEAREFREYCKLPKIEPDYLRLLSRWENTFGRDALLVRPYERPALPHGDIVADLSAQIGLDSEVGLVRPTVNRPLNATYPRNVINCILWARKAGMSKDDIASLRQLLTAVYGDRPSAADYLAPSDRTALLREFEAANQAVAHRYLGRTDGVLFQDLAVGDEAEWRRRYDHPLADLTISVADIRGALAGHGRG